jgi:hypothetical protein
VAKKGSGSAATNSVTLGSAAPGGVKKQAKIPASQKGTKIRTGTTGSKKVAKGLG